MIAQDNTTANEAKVSIELTNEIGLHARPSVKLTQVTKRFSSRIEISTSGDGPWTDAKSPVKVMRMKALKGDMLHFRALGMDAGMAVSAVADLVRRNFGEE